MLIPARHDSYFIRAQWCKERKRHALCEWCEGAAPSPAEVLFSDCPGLPVLAWVVEEPARVTAVVTYAAQRFFNDPTTAVLVGGTVFCPRGAKAAHSSVWEWLGWLDDHNKAALAATTTPQGSTPERKDHV